MSKGDIINLRSFHSYELVRSDDTIEIGQWRNLGSTLSFKLNPSWTIAISRIRIFVGRTPRSHYRIHNTIKITNTIHFSKSVFNNNFTFPKVFYNLPGASAV